MSKYVDSLIKGNQTLSAEVKLLKQENEKLYSENYDLKKDNYNLKQSRNRLKELSCYNKSNCPLCSNNELNGMMNILNVLKQ